MVPSGGGFVRLRGEEREIMSTQIARKSVVALQLRGLIAGTQKHPSGGPSALDGVTYTGATLLQTLQGLEDALTAVDTSRAAWKDALQNADEALAKVQPVVQAYRSWLLATFGNSPAMLADFGMSPRKGRTPLTTDQQAQANARSEATRKARHTMGSKQRLKVTGASSTTPPATQEPGPTAPPPTLPQPPATAPKPTS
jgi:hypothetical protein